MTWSENYRRAVAGLDTYQRRVHDEIVGGSAPKVIVPAGAGAGKTTTSISAIATLLNEGALRPEEILCISFTRAARKAMLDKATTMVDPSHARALWNSIATFHKFAYPWAIQHMEGDERAPQGFGGDSPFKWGKQRPAPAWMSDDRTKAPSEYSLAWALLVYPKDPAERSKSVPGLDYGNRYSSENVNRGAIHVMTEEVAKEDKNARRLIGQYVSMRNRALSMGYMFTDPDNATRNRAIGEEIEHRFALSRFMEFLKTFERARFNMRIREYSDSLYWFMKRSKMGRKLVICDEYQDCNEMQIAIVDNLTTNGGGRQVCVGDVRQSIFGFQGANPRNMEARIRGGETLVTPIPSNYRSLRTIVDLGNAIAGTETWSVGVPSIAMRNQPVSTQAALSTVRYLPPTQDSTGYDALAEQIHADIRERGGGFGEYAVLTRTNDAADAVEVMGLIRGVPVVRLGQPRGVLNRVESVALFRWLQLADAGDGLRMDQARILFQQPGVARTTSGVGNNRKTVETVRDSIFGVPKIPGLGPKGQEAIQLAAAQAPTLSAAFKAAASNIQRAQYAATQRQAPAILKLDTFWGMLQASQRSGGYLGAVEFLAKYLKVTLDAGSAVAVSASESDNAAGDDVDVDAEGSTADDPDAASSTSTVRIFLNVAYRLDTLENLTALVQQQVPAFRADGNDENEFEAIERVRRNSVTVSTMHRSKGLEWSHVYVVASDNYYPTYIPGVVIEEDESPEARRLFYVAVTRAMDSVTFSWPVDPTTKAESKSPWITGVAEPYTEELRAMLDVVKSCSDASWTVRERLDGQVDVSPPEGGEQAWTLGFNYEDGDELTGSVLEPSLLMNGTSVDLEHLAEALPGRAQPPRRGRTRPADMTSAYREWADSVGNADAAEHAQAVIDRAADLGAPLHDPCEIPWESW